MDLDAIFSHDTKPELKFPTMSESVGRNVTVPVLDDDGEFHGNSCLVIDDIPVSTHREISENKEPPMNVVVKDTRDMMNAGKPYNTILQSLGGKYTRDFIKQASDGIRDQLRLYGLVGKCLVDARGYSSCRAAVAVANGGHSAKASMRGIIGCTCGTAYCRTTGLKVVSSESDLDDQWFDDSFIEARNLVSIDSSEKEKIDSLGKVRRFARLAEIVDAGRQKVAQATPSNEFFAHTFVGEEIEISVEVDKTPVDVEVSADKYDDGELVFDSPSDTENQVVEVSSEPDKDLVIQEGNELTF